MRVAIRLSRRGQEPGEIWWIPFGGKATENKPGPVAKRLEFRIIKFALEREKRRLDDEKRIR